MLGGWGLRVRERTSNVTVPILCGSLASELTGMLLVEASTPRLQCGNRRPAFRVRQGGGGAGRLRRRPNVGPPAGTEGATVSSHSTTTHAVQLTTHSHRPFCAPSYQLVPTDAYLYLLSCCAFYMRIPTKRVDRRSMMSDRGSYMSVLELHSFCRLFFCRVTSVESPQPAAVQRKRSQRWIRNSPKNVARVDQARASPTHPHDMFDNNSCYPTTPATIVPNFQISYFITCQVKKKRKNSEKANTIFLAYVCFYTVPSSTWPMHPTGRRTVPLPSPPPSMAESVPQQFEHGGCSPASPCAFSCVRHGPCASVAGCTSPA